jgi:hypothetical protein
MEMAVVIPTFDPTVSESLDSLPESLQQLVGATRYRSFLSVTPNGDWLRSIGPNFLYNEQSC